jgi:eukaryotic-like serine/threonine-protein kinase
MRAARRPVRAPCMTTHPTLPPQLVPGTIVAERYRVERMLGEGAMGAVYLVEHVHMRKLMALKVLHATFTQNAEIVARFEREAIAAGHLDHPNVVAATDFGRTEQGAFFLVLEYVDGTSLREVVGAPLEIGRAVRITRQIAAALVRAHELGLVHRDLKPENVMLVQREGSGEVAKVLDFGIAKLDADAFAAAGATPQLGGSVQPLTQMGMIFGTPDYMAPEQALGETVDARADLYALGVMLYEMLTGLRPFEADSLGTLLRMHVADPVPPMALRAPGVAVPASLEAITRRLLEKEPAARFASARDLDAALDDAVRSEGMPPMSSTPQLPLGSLPEAAPSARVVVSAPNMAPADAMSTGVSPTMVAGSSAGVHAALARLPAPLRRVPPAVLLGGLAFGVVAVVVVLALALGGGGGKLAPGAAGAAKQGDSRRPVLDDARVQAAVSAGPDALEALARSFPADPRPLRELARAYESRGRLDDAARAVGRLAAVDPSPLDTPSERILIAALEGPPEAVDAAVAALEGPLGARGVDLLLELTAKSARSSPRHAFAAATQKRLADSLASPDVRAHASSSAAVVLELKDAKRCEAKKAALAHATSNGDERSLAYLKPLVARSGCGFLGVADCWSCLRRDDALAEAIGAIEARTRDRGR